MKQAITGVSPSTASETTVMTVFPSIAAWSLGRALGQFYAIESGLTKSITFGRIFLALGAPLALPLFFLNLAPWVCRRYRLTNRRVIVQQGLKPTDERWVGLGDFDAIQIEDRPGYAWYRCGDLVFRKGQIETFRLYAVRRPETFRATCMKAHKGFVGVNKALQAEAAHA